MDAASLEIVEKLRYHLPGRQAARPNVGGSSRDPGQRACRERNTSRGPVRYQRQHDQLLRAGPAREKYAAPGYERSSIPATTAE